MDDWALVVGIDLYPKAGVNRLEGAVGDAVRFHKWVTAPRGGNITDPARVKLLTSPANISAGDLPRPINSEITEFFFALLNVQAGRPGRRLYVFLSGHGISPTGQESVRNAALLMANAAAPNLWFNFPGNVWAEGIRSSAQFREVVLIMDCCRDLKNNAQVVPHIFGDPTQDAKDCVLMEAYATQWASKTREMPLPGSNDPKCGVFTYSILEVLNSGKVSGALFKRSVNAHLARTLQGQQTPQETEIRGNPDDKVLADIVFGENAEEPRTRVSVKGQQDAQPEILRLPSGEGGVEPVNGLDWSLQNDVWSTLMSPDQYLLRKPNNGLHQFSVYAAVPVELTVVP